MQSERQESCYHSVQYNKIIVPSNPGSRCKSIYEMFSIIYLDTTLFFHCPYNVLMSDVGRDSKAQYCKWEAAWENSTSAILIIGACRAFPGSLQYTVPHTVQRGGTAPPSPLDNFTYMTEEHYPHLRRIDITQLFVSMRE